MNISVDFSEKDEPMYQGAAVVEMDGRSMLHTRMKKVNRPGDRLGRKRHDLRASLMGRVTRSR
jgi:hypothetical protein